jgi:hypothetical protein
MNATKSVIGLLLVPALAAAGCRTAKYRSPACSSAKDAKKLIAAAWLEDLVNHGEAVANPGVHHQYARVLKARGTAEILNLPEILPRLKKDIRRHMPALVASRGSEPEIISLKRGFAAKYETVLLAFLLLDSKYILLDIDPAKPGGE